MRSVKTSQEIEAWLDNETYDNGGFESSKAIQRLSRDNELLISAFARLCRYRRRDAEVLWNDSIAYLERLRTVKIDSVELSGERDRPASTVFRPFECTVVCLPSNAIVPLAPIFVACADVLGTRLVLTGPEGQLDLIAQLTDLVSSSGRCVLWRARTRDLVKGAIEAKFADQIYFLGSSSIYPALARDCAEAGIALRFEGQGNGLAYVSDTANPRFAASMLLESKAFCEGRMCSSPTGILVSRSVADEFLYEFAAAAERISLAEPLARSVTAKPWRDLLDMQTPGWEEIRTPLLVEVASSPEVGESYSPVAWFQRSASFGEALLAIRRSRFRLQVSYFGSDEQELQELSAFRYARTCVNMSPSDQDPLLPWGNFSASGESPVEEFLFKFGYSAIVEGSLR